MTIAGHKTTVIAGNRDVGVLYGVFRFLRELQTNQPVASIAIADVPRVQLRMLDHWDNLDRSVERGYAGESLWDWAHLPDSLPARYRDYARANASIGVNATALTNVNANAKVLTREYLLKVKALADVFRPYGIRVFLTARFSAPIEIGGLKTADPLDPTVRRWWKTKVDEIYRIIPDFGGLLVKANSEGQPGPQDYKRTHADGANMLADALAPHGGVAMWRAFVYSNTVPVDRIKQAYDEFKPLDGAFRDNVLVQVKNGPLDFQPREPFHPLFGAMPKTPLMMEFQITKEYLGQDTHLAYLGPLYEEVLNADTWAEWQGIDGRKGRRRFASQIRAHGNGGRREHWHRSQLDRLAVQPGELVRVRPACVESLADVRCDCGRVDSHDVLERRRRRRAGETHDDELARSCRELYDAAWPRPHHGDRASLWPRTVGESGPSGLDAGLLPSGGYDRHRLRSNDEREAMRWSSTFRRCGRDTRTASRLAIRLLLFFHHVRWTDTTRSGRTVWGSSWRATTPASIRSARCGARGLGCAVRSTLSGSTRSRRSSRFRKKRQCGGATRRFNTFSSILACRFRRDMSSRRMR